MSEAVSDLSEARSPSSPHGATGHIRCAAALARVVAAVRKSAEPGEEQQKALGSLVSLAAERSFTLRFYDDILTLDDHPIVTSDRRLAEFAYCLAAQSVAEITVARGAEPLELLALTVGLAQEPGYGRIKQRLRDAGSTRVMVVLTPQLDGANPALSVRDAFARLKNDEAVKVEWEKFLLHGREAASERQVDLGLAIPGFETEAPAACAVPPAAPAAPAAPEATVEPPPRVADPGANTEAPARPAVPAATVSAPGAPGARASGPRERPTLQPATPLSIALGRLLGEPYSSDALQALNALVRQIQDCFKQDRTAEAIDACNVAMELEARAPGGLRSGYDAILRRTLHRSALEKVAPYLLEPRRKERATAILRRAGEESVRLLVDLLAAGDTVAERLAYLEVLRGLPRGLDRVVSLLGSSEWHVVRNAAEALGEARVAEAATYLARLLEHQDERVRRTALVALATLGSPATVAALRDALRSAAPELRARVASSIGGAHADALVAVLEALAAEERHADVIRSYSQALGRIGTPRAREVLERAAARKSFFSRRRRIARTAARETLERCWPRRADAPARPRPPLDALVRGELA